MQRTEANRRKFRRRPTALPHSGRRRPQGIYAYDARSVAAQYARKLGLEADYKMALTMLDKLCKDFPDNPRNFYARLSQAEILRLLNAFADAAKTLRGNHQQIFLTPRNTFGLAGARRLRPCPARKNPQRPRDFRAPVRPSRYALGGKGGSRIQMRLCARTRRTFARSQRNALGHVGTAVEERRCRRLP